MRTASHSELEIFLAIARQLNLSRAAIDLGVSPSALSHALRGFEEKLGVRLFNRTTRSVALTEAGSRLLARLAPAFRDIDDALEDLNHFRDKPTGLLRISSGRASTQIVLLPLVARFLRAFPEIRVEILDNDAMVDIVSSGADAGVRFGERLEADMVAIPIGPAMRSVVVASPAFFAAHPVPQHPQDLLGLPCIRHRFPSGLVYRWEFAQADCKLETQVDGPLTLGDVGLMTTAALNGAGLAYVFEEMVRDHLAAGRLVQVLDDWCPPYPGLYLYYPSRRQIPAVLRSFVEFVKADTH